MGIGRLSGGKRISGGSAILLFVFLFFKWYGLGLSKTSNLLFDFDLLRQSDYGGNAWQTLEVTPIFLVLAIVVTVGAALLQLTRLDREPPVAPGSVVCVLGGLAALLILIRIVFPPDFGFEINGYVYEPIQQVGIFLALAAACGIAYGGYRAMREEGRSFAGLWVRRRSQR